MEDITWYMYLWFHQIVFINLILVFCCTFFALLNTNKTYKLIHTGKIQAGCRNGACSSRSIRLDGFRHTGSKPLGSMMHGFTRSSFITLMALGISYQTSDSSMVAIGGQWLHVQLEKKYLTIFIRIISRTLAFII